MASKTSARRLTYDDFVNFPDDGQRHELIDGEHYVTPSPATKHQRVAKDLLVSLDIYLASHPIGEVFIAPFDVVMSHFDVVEPDLLVVLSDQADIVTDKHVRGVPAIVIEILSPGTKRIDAGVKFGLYERAGVKEYWLVDPERDAVTLYRRGADGRFASADEFVPDGGILRSALLPDWSLSLATLFRTR